MADIPGFVWVIIGVFISVVSLFIGFLHPVAYSAFFKLMFVVGIGMLIYGYIFKIRFGQKSKEEMIEDRKQELMQKRGSYEADIDMEDYRNNPYMRQEAMNRGYPGTEPTQEFRQMERQYQDRIQPQQKSQQAQQRAQQPQYQRQPVQTQSQRPSYQSQYPAQAQMRQASQRFCTSCGTPLLKEHKFCPICGARV